MVACGLCSGPGGALHAPRRAEPSRGRAGPQGTHQLLGRGASQHALWLPWLNPFLLEAGEVALSKIKVVFGAGTWGWVLWEALPSLVAL